MSVTEHRRLPIWCAEGRQLNMARIREAKEALWIDYLVRPTNASPSIEDRVLAWGSAPPFVVAYALVDPHGSDEQLLEALAWVLHESDECSVAMSVEQVLDVLMGHGVREVPVEELEAEARLADYQEGR